MASPDIREGPRTSVDLWLATRLSLHHGRAWSRTDNTGSGSGRDGRGRSGRGDVIETSLPPQDAEIRGEGLLQCSDDMWLDGGPR